MEKKKFSLFAWMQKIPGGIILVPLFIGIFMNTFFPQALQIGGFTTGMFKTGTGCLLGLFFCAELIRFLLKRYPRQTYSAILGFVVGSVFPIFPGWAYIAPVAAFGVGAAAIVVCDKFASPAK